MTLSITGRIATLFDIKAGEGRLVGLLFAHSMLNGWAQTVTLSVSYSLFVAAFGAQNLPYRYIGGALLTLIGGLLYGWLAQRVAFARLLSANLIVMLLGLCALRFALDLPQTGMAIAALGVWYNVIAVFPDLEFWSLSGRLLDVRQAKRLFPPIGLGQLVAMVLGGLLIPWLIGVVGTPSLLLAAAAGLAGSFALLRLLVREFSLRLEPPASQQLPAHVGTRLSKLLSDKYVLLIFAFMIVYESAYLFTDNIFVASAAVQFPSTAELAGFLAIFGAAGGLASLLIRGFGLNPLVFRFGLTGGLLAWPLAISLGSAATVVSGLALGIGLTFFWATTVTRLAERAFKRSTFQPSLQIVYQPLSQHKRIQTQSLNETVIDSIGVIVGSLALLALIHLAGFDPTQLAIVQFLLAVAVSGLALALGRSYPGKLLNALNKKHLIDTDLELADRASIEVLEQGLLSPQPAIVLAALEILERAAPNRLVVVLPPLLAHASPPVRGAALEVAARQQVREVLPLARAELRTESSPALRAAATQALAALGGSAVAGELAVLLDDPAPEVAVAACAGLLREERSQAAPGWSRMRDWSNSPDPATRAQAAQALGQSGRSDLYDVLALLLQDDAAQVRIAALTAAGALKHHALWPLVVAALSQGLTSQASAALVAAGDAALPAIRQGLANPALGRTAQVALARACARIDSIAARDVLAASISHHNDDVRTQVAQSLAQGEYWASGQVSDLAKKQIKREVGAAAEYCAALADLEAVESAALLRAALDQRLDQARDRILLLLALVYDGPTVLRVRHNLHDASPQKRAYALEVLELQTEPGIRKMVFPLFDDLSPAERLMILPATVVGPLLGASERLTWIASGNIWRSPWLRACAAYAIERAAPRQNGAAAPLDDLVGKVVALQQVAIFAAAPGEALAEVAARLETVTMAAGQQLFAKGDSGACLYIVATGRVRIHDGGHTLNELDAGQVFGEMALLDSSARLATATTIDATTLLRLDQEPFFEILTAHSEVLRGAMRVLSARLRARVQDLVALQELTHFS